MIPKGCIVQQPPIIMTSTCDFNITSGRLIVSVTGFDQPLSGFFQLALQNFLSPRSTTPYSTFVFNSYDSSGDQKKVLDFQSSNILARATKYEQLNTLKLASSSELVAEENQTLRVTLVSGLNFKRTDGLTLNVPKWNPKAGPSAESFFQSPITCVMIVGPIAPSNCYLIEGEEFDTVVIPSFQVHVPAAAIISFSVGPFLNPISTQLQSGFKLFVRDQYDGISLENEGFLQITQPSLVPSQKSRLVVNDTLITNQASFELSVNLVVPLEKGCQIKIKIPDLLVIGKSLSKIELGGMLGGMISVEFTFEPDKRQLIIQNACYDYKPNVGPAIIRISTMQNPGYVIQADSFQVFFNTEENYPISVATGGMNFSTTPGTIEAGEWTASNYLVSSSQELTMRFQPHHEASQYTKIVVTLPKQDLIIPLACLISDYNFLVNSQGMDCSADVTSNSITFKDLIFDSYKYKPGGKHIEVAILNVIMPSSIRPTGVYSIDFYDLVGDTYRLVDTSQFTNLIQADSGELAQVNIRASQDSTWVTDTLTVTFQATHEILRGGWIEMIVPAELQLQDNSVCINLFNADAKCLFIGGKTIRIVGGFESSGSLPGLMVSFQVTNVRTQRSTKPSSTFKFRTLDSNGFEIDTHQYFKMTPQATQTLQDYTLEQSNNVVGGQSSILISLKSPIPLFQQDSLVVTFPSDDMAQELAVTYQSCQGTKQLVNDALNCVLSGLNTLVIEIEFDSIDQVGPNTWIQFKITNVANPTSTKPSKPINLQIKDQYGFDIIQITPDDTEQKQKFTLKASSPADLIFASVAAESSVAFATTGFTFTIVTRYLLPPHSNINVVIPAQIGTVKEQINCWVSSKPDSDNDCQLVKNVIFLYDINEFSIVGGTTLQIEIQGLVNSKSSDPTSSFTVTTLTSQFDLVDSISSGLQVSSSCNYPCNSCPLGQPSVCRKCTTTQASLFPLYYEGTCLDSCPSHFYPFNQVCSECHSGCLECTATSKQCTKCAAGFYLLGTVCMDFCPDNYYSNDETRLCDPCELPCETCSQSTTHCTSCSQSQTLKSFFQNKCYDSCPVGPSVFSKGECLACTPDCLTCADSFDTCKTCRSDKQSFLDFTSYHCVDQCPAEISVATVRNPQLADQSQLTQLKTCEKCDVTCKTCQSDDKNQCTQCATGLKFNEEDRKCLKSCPPRTAELYIPITDDFICVKCKPGCSDCQYQRDQCTACDPGLVFFQYDCLAECPYGFKTVSDVEQVCVRDGEVCDFGYAYNSTGQCDLTVPHCQTGYVLNSKDDLCIPEPGVHVPGLFLAVAAAWTTSVLVMRFLKDKDMPTSQLINQLLIGLVTIQQIAYYTMFLLSFQLNYSFVVLLHLIGFVVGLIINTAALIYSFVHLPKDLPFKHWKDKNLKANYIIMAAAMAVSYKLFRGLVCGLMKRDCLLAVFEDKFRNFTRPIILMTAVGFVLQVAPIAYINIYTLIQIPVWGYEIRTLGIESLILACVVAALEIYDYLLQLTGQKELPRVSQLKLNPKSKKQVTFNVMSGFDDNNDQQNLIKQSNATLSSQVDLLEALNKQIMEKQKHKDMESRFDDKILDQNGGLMTLKEKKEYITEKRQNFEAFRLQPKKTFDEVANLQMGKKFINEPNDEVIQQVGLHFKKINPVGRVESAIDFYERRSEEEVERDIKEFQIHYTECDAKIKHDQKKNNRLCESFDDEYLRDPYDDFGVCSDFESQQSWISYPPQKSKIFEDTYLIAKANLLSEKIKWKFMYNNVGKDLLPAKVIIPKLDFPSRKTQTCINTITSDPFESSEESECSSGRFSAVDSKIAKRIFVELYEGQTDSNYLNSARSKASKVKVSIDSNDLNIVAIGSSKKRPRRQTAFLNNDDASVDSCLELQKQHIQPVPMMNTFNIDIEVNEDYDEEQQIDNEIQRLKSNLSMDMASVPGNVSYKSVSEEEGEQNFQIGTIQRVSRGGKKKRDRMMYRAYLPDDAQLSYLNMHYPDPRESIQVSSKKVPTKASVQEKNLNIKDQSISDNVSSAVDTATEGANAGRLQSVEPNQFKDHFTHTAWDESGTSESQKNLLHTVGMASSQTFNIEATAKKEERKVFNKFEHGYLFNFKQPQSAKKKMINGVEYLPPVPFRKRTDQPFRSTKTKMMEMERGKNQTVGSEKLQELESVYLGSRNGVNDTRMSSFVHLKSKPQRPTTASVERGAALMQHRDLRKQNFMEDGKQLVQRRLGSAGARRQQTSNSRVESRPQSSTLQNDLKIALERMGLIRKLEQARHQRESELQ